MAFKSSVFVPVTVIVESVVTSEKSMTVEAKNATDDNFSSVGTLVVEEGQQLVITPALDKGEIKFGFVAVPEEQSIDELPDMDAKPDYEVTVSGEEVQTVEAAPGSYQIMVTPVQTATGTVPIDVKGK